MHFALESAYKKTQQAGCLLLQEEMVAAKRKQVVPEQELLATARAFGYSLHLPILFDLRSALHW